jgi:hypothetical protein
LREPRCLAPTFQAETWPCLLEARQRFQETEAAPATEREALWAKLQPELELHEQIEERFVDDPVAQDAAGRDCV